MQKYKYIFTTKRLQQLLGPIAILVVACCVYWAKQELTSSGLKSNSELQTLQCNFVNSECRFLLDGQPSVASFDATPEAEESVSFSIELPAEEHVEQAWIEGVNMYMGKIPIIMELDDSGIWQGWFMLGSCSEPVMQWRITISLKGRNTPATLYFTTSRS